MFQNQGGFTASRYRDMDYDGVDAEIIFPNKGLTNWQSPDPEMNVVMCRAWTDWAHENVRRSQPQLSCGVYCARRTSRMR